MYKRDILEQQPHILEGDQEGKGREVDDDEDKDMPLDNKFLQL